MNWKCRKLSALGIVVCLAAVAMAAWAQDPPAGPPAAPAAHERGALRPAFPGPHHNRPLTQEQINDVLAVLKTQDPQLAARVQAALKAHPEKLRELLAPHWPRLQRLAELKRSDPTLFNLTMEEIRLNRQTWPVLRNLQQAIRQQDAPRQTELHRQLHELVAQQFDVRQKIRRRELDNMAKRLALLRKEIEAREKDRAAVIDDHIANLLKFPRGTPPRTTQPDF